MEFVDTHCHIQFADYPLDSTEVIKAASTAGVSRLIAVGCTVTDSELSVKMAEKNKNVWASIGLHPHEGSVYVNDTSALQRFRDLAEKDKVIAIGETGLDYHYMHSSKDDQQKLLRFQLDLASQYDLPVIFHVRQAFDDFWEIFDQYQGLRGVVHSFTADNNVLDEILARDLFVGINGIMTFTKDKHQLEAAKAIPLQKLLLETDAPFLTPTPYRGTICEPKHVVVTAEFLAELRNETLAALSKQTTTNARELFGI